MRLAFEVKGTIMHQQSRNNIKADWFADDLGLYRDRYNLNVLSVHKHVINFQVDRWPHLLMVAGTALERGPATVGLNHRDFMLLSAQAHEISGGAFKPFKIELTSNKKISTVQWSKDGAVSFAPIRFAGLDLQLLKETAKTYRHMLAKHASPSASSVLNGLPGGEEYFRDQIKNSFPVLTDALAKRNPSQFLQHAFNLIGLGRGFSPECDDLIYGALLAYHYFDYDSLLADILKNHFVSLVEATNQMGGHLITMGLNGLAAETVIDFLRSLAAGVLDKLILYKVSDIGHSTGPAIITAILYYIDIIDKHI